MDTRNATSMGDLRMREAVVPWESSALMGGTLNEAHEHQQLVVVRGGGVRPDQPSRQRAETDGVAAVLSCAEEIALLCKGNSNDAATAARRPSTSLIAMRHAENRRSKQCVTLTHRGGLCRRKATGCRMGQYQRVLMSERSMSAEGRG